MKNMLILIVFLSAQISAETLTVIYEHPDKLPITPYLPEPAEEVEDDTEKHGALFPVHSPRLSPGKVTARKVDLPYLQSPMFVVGYDPLSLAWLKSTIAQLKTLGATGLVVSVNTEEEFEEIKQITEDLHVMPVSGDGIATFLELTHYPALISRQGIEQ